MSNTKEVLKRRLTLAAEHFACLLGVLRRARETIKIKKRREETSSHRAFFLFFRPLFFLAAPTD